MHYQIKWITLLIASLWLGRVNSQWCCVDSSLLIKDRSTVSLKLLISSALNNNLADTTQGVCGVRVKFQHEFIGDLTMDLISPSGQRLRLVGPIGNSGISDFSNWYITFIPCGEKANPDKGFKMKWDNQQAWGIFGKFYNGTYYPQGGCLEQFDMGSVNGIWTLEVHDDERFYEGQIESFCLLFCDPAGINCMDCSPNGGVFVNDRFIYCLGNPLLAFQERITFPVYKPDSLSYSYTYLISSQDQIIYIGNTLDLRNYPIGDYTICGLSYLTMDSIKLPAIGEAYSKFRNDLVINANSFCAEISKNCVDVSIYPNYYNIQDSFFLCRGDTLHLGGSSYFEDGIFTIPLLSSFACDSIVDLQIRLVDMDIKLESPDTITCKNPIVQLDISNSTKTSRTKIEWTTMDGNFIELLDSLRPKINQSGTYKVVFNDGFCSDSLEFSIIKRDQVPTLKVVADTINCLKSNATLLAKTDASLARFRWNDGTMDIGSDSLLQTNIPGTYYVTVTDDAGCSNLASITVIRDTLKPDLILQSDLLTCKDSIGNLSFTTKSMLNDFLWTGPNLFQSNLNPASINTPGLYTLTATSDNGCINSASVRISSTIVKPDYIFMPDTLNCLNNFTIQLNVITNAVVDSIIYTNALGFKSTVLNPVVMDSGYYHVTLIDTGICVLDTMIYVPLDSSRPLFQLFGGVLDCFKDSLQIILQDLNGLPGLNYHWTGPVGYDTYVSSPFVKEFGVYYVNVTGLNGCSTLDSINILQDTLKPIIQLTGGQLDCSVQNIQINTDVSVSSTYDWSGPGLFSSILEDPIVQDSGLYKIIATSLNGCKTEKSIFINMNRESPILNLRGVDLNCILDSVTIAVNLKQAADSILWTDPFGIEYNTDSIFVFKPGRYKVFVRGTNGCMDSAFITINKDTLEPNLQLLSDTITCSRDFATITASSLDSIVFYKWKNPVNDSFNTKNILSSYSGWHFINVTASNGCINSDSIFVEEKKDLPVYQFISDSISCFDTLARLSLICNEPGVRYQWFGPGNFTANSSSVLLSTGGWYTFVITNAFDCSVRDSFELRSFLQTPQILYSDTTVNCLTKSNPRLKAFSQDSLSSFDWTTPSGNILQGNPIAIVESGKYIFNGINLFGCRVSDTMLVTFDTLNPVIQNIQLDTLSCSKIQFIPLVEVQPASSNYQWIGPSNFNSNLPNPIIRLPGLYQLTLIAPNLCRFDTTILILKDSLLPVIIPRGAVINCASDSAQIGVQSNDSLVNVFWQSPKLDFINQRNPFVRDTGWYQLIVEGKNNCLLLDSVFVGLDRKPPLFSIRDTILDCNYDSIQVLYQTMETNVQFQWIGPGNFSSNLKNPFLYDSGIYSLRLTGLNQCFQVDSFYVKDNRQIPELFATSDTINCKQSFAQLTSIFDTLRNYFIWSGPTGLDSIQVNPKVNFPGNYTLQIRNQWGCENDTTIQVIVDTLLPVLQINYLDSLICDKDEIWLYSQSNCNLCQYSWSTTDGLILSDVTKDSIMIKGSGNYRLQIENPQNECTKLESISIVKDSLGIIDIDLFVEDITCFGLNDGEIQISAVIGKYPPYLFSTDGIAFRQINDLQNLAPGWQHLFFKDRFGCLKDTLVLILEPPPASLDLGRDTSILLGSNYFIDTQTNLDTTSLQSLIWDPNQDLNCINCLRVTAAPKIDTRYTLKLVDSKGCVIGDAITIKVFVNTDLFIPNSFTPNGDNINDFFSLYSPKGSIFINFASIYDRWGNQLFSKSNFDVSGEFPLWNGQTGDYRILPGVYIYLIELQSANGKRRILKGDLTLLR